MKVKICGCEYYNKSDSIVYVFHCERDIAIQSILSEAIIHCGNKNNLLENHEATRKRT